MLKTTLFSKKTDKQSYLHEKSNHPVLFKKSIQTVKYCVSKKSVQQTEIKKIKLLNRKELLTPKATQKTQMLPLTVIYNRVFQYKINNIKSLAHLKGTLMQI